MADGNRQAGKRNRWPLPDSKVFAMRGTDVKWPTLRGAYLNDQNVTQLRKLAFGVIFLDGPYNTRLNGVEAGEPGSQERAVFFEHLHQVDGDHLFLLCWIGNYHSGAIFHCAWQFPQHLNWPTRALEWAAFRTYKQIAKVLYSNTPSDAVDHEVTEFLAPRS